MSKSATVLLISKSGKSMFVRVSTNKYDLQGKAGYCLNPDGAKVGDVITSFPEVSGIEHRKNEKGEVMATSKGEPLSFLVFA